MLLQDTRRAKPGGSRKGRTLAPVGEKDMGIRAGRPVWPGNTVTYIHHKHCLRPKILGSRGGLGGEPGGL